MPSRINYQTIIAKYKALGKGNVRLTQSSLFLTKDINSQVTTYNFDVLETQTQTLQNDEIRLNINDEFIITTLGMYLVAETTYTNAETGEVKKGTKLLTYAPYENKGTVVSLQNFYAGALQISVNNIVYLDKYDVRKHEFLPRTQFANFITPNQATLPSNDYSKNAMFPMEPLLTLSGAKKNNITLTIPESISAQSWELICDNGDKVLTDVTRVGVLMRGLNAQNGSVFQS